MNSFSSLIRSKTSMAIGLYILVFVSLGVLARAQLNAMQLVQPSRAVLGGQ